MRVRHGHHRCSPCTGFEGNRLCGVSSKQQLGWVGGVSLRSSKTVCVVLKVFMSLGVCMDVLFVSYLLTVKKTQCFKCSVCVCVCCVTFKKIFGL